MASKFDKPYINVVLPDINKINSILSQSAEIDTQKILQLSMINKLPLPLVIDTGSNNLIHLAINNINSKSEFNILNYIKFLVQQQVNPDQPNKENQTPLHLACQNQYLEIVNFLIEQQVDVNYQDNNGLTPLHYLLSGNIKVYNEKEITEFIVPSSEKKTSKIEREDLLKLKKELWEILKEDKYQWVFEGLERTIEYYIDNNDEIKEKILELKRDLATTSNNLFKSNDSYLKYRQNIEDIILKKWDKFAPSDDIVLHDQEPGSLSLGKDMGIIKNSDVKTRVKDNIKQSINEGLELINSYQYAIPTNNLYDDLGELLSNTLLGQANSTQLINNLNDVYKNNITTAFDFADNIIDIDNLLFIGGSRQITINDTDYLRLRDKLMTLPSIEKKVIFILLIEYFKNYYLPGLAAIYDSILVVINGFDDVNFDIDFQKLLILNQENFDFSTGIFRARMGPNLDDKYIAIINIANQACKEIFEDNNQVSKNNLGQRIYSRYLNTILQHTPGSNLDYDLHKLFFKLIAALNNYPVNLEDSLNNVFKIDILENVNPLEFDSIQRNKNKLAIWTGFLLKKSIPLDAVASARFDPNYSVNPAFNANFAVDDPLINIMDSIRDINSNNQEIAANVLEYYNSVNNTIPKLYILDLIFYLLKPSKFIWYDTSNPVFRNIFLDGNHKWLKSGYDILQDEYCPSISKIIYLTFENVSTFSENIPRLNNLYTYLFCKFRESIELNLLFNGCLPELMEPANDAFSIVIKRERREERLSFNFNNNQWPEDFIVLPPIRIVDLPLPFNYFYNTTGIYGIWNNNAQLRNKYFLFVQDRYRPPYSKSLNRLIINNFNSYNKILENIMKVKFTNIFTTLLSKKQKISQIYSEFYLTSKLILNNQSEILKTIISEDEISLFNLDEFTTKLNSINANIFMYYYLYKNKVVTKLPEFIFYKLNTNQYLLYNNTNNNASALIQDKFELVGGALNLLDSNFINSYYFGLIEIVNDRYKIVKNNPLPPSLEDNLNDFYQLNKIKFIVDILETYKDQPLITNIEKSFKLNINDDDKWSFIYLNIAKIIEELIRDRTMYSLKVAIDNSMLTDIVNIRQINPNLQSNIITPFYVSTVLLQTLNDINDAFIDINRNKLALNFYKFSDPNTYEKCNFIIYPNDYTNTDLLQQKYCIKINEKIITSLLAKNAQPLLLDNNQNACINPILSSYNYNILQKVLTNRIYFNKIEFNKNELHNHIKKLFNNNYKDSIESFIKPQYEEIKLLVLSDQTNGNNLFINLKNSFKICFYLMNEYLTDYLWRFDSSHQKEHFDDIIKILNYKPDHIIKTYLLEVANSNSLKLFDSDEVLIQNEFIELLENEKNKLLDYKNKLDIEFNSLKTLRLSTTSVENKIRLNTDNINEINNQIGRLTVRVNINKFNKYNSRNKKERILTTYNKLFNDKGKGISNSIWSLLLEDEKLLEKSFNLSLLQMLKYQSNNSDDNIVEEYFNHISKPAHLYFESPKYTNPKINKVMCYIYEVLVYLTKSQICFGIEILFRKTIYNHIKNSYLEYDIGLIISKIDQIFNQNFIYQNNESSFIEVLYNEVPKKLVKNSITAFEDLDEKINFEPETPLNIIRSLVKLIENSRSIKFTDELLLNLNTNIANYFDLFVNRTIKNWYVVCENVLKFVINQQRITKTLSILQNIPRVSTVTVLHKIGGTYNVLVSRRGQHELNGTLISQGGHVESYESFEEAAKREVLEEAGITIDIKDLKLIFEKTINKTRFNNYYVIYTTMPKITGPQPNHQFELQDVDIILGIPTEKDGSKNTRLAWIPIDKILLPAPIEDTLFTKILQKIKLVIG